MHDALGTTAGPVANAANLAQFAKHCKNDLNLTKGEILQLINLVPTSQAEIYLVCVVCRLWMLYR